MNLQPLFSETLRTALTFSLQLALQNLSIPQPTFIPNTVRPSVQRNKHLQGLFCASNFLDTASPQLTIYLKATKKHSGKCCVTFIETDVILSHPPSHCISPQDFWLLEYLAWHPAEHMVCTQGNHLMIINNDASITTRSLPEQKEPLGRLHAALHIAFKQQQTPQTHSSQITEKDFLKSSRSFG